MTYIYALIDPDTNEPFYVGRTHYPETRLQQHFESTTMVVEMLKVGKIPKMEVLAHYDPVWHDFDMVEYAWINRLKSCGYSIQNALTKDGYWFADEGDCRIFEVVSNKIYEVKLWREPPPLTDDDALLQVLGISAVDFYEQMKQPYKKDATRRRSVLKSRFN